MIASNINIHNETSYSLFFFFSQQHFKQLQETNNCQRWFGREPTAELIHDSAYIWLLITCVWSSFSSNALAVHARTLTRGIIIKFALTPGYGLSDERSLTRNKRANEWWGGRGRFHVKKTKWQKQTESIRSPGGCEKAAQHPSRVLMCRGLTGIPQKASWRANEPGCYCINSLSFLQWATDATSEGQTLWKYTSEESRRQRLNTFTPGSTRAQTHS